MMLGRLTVLPTMFTIDDGFSDRFPNRNRFLSRPVPPRNPVAPSHPVNQMASQLPVPFPPRDKQTGAFSHTVPRKDPIFLPPAEGETVSYRAVPLARRIALGKSCHRRRNRLA